MVRIKVAKMKIIVFKKESHFNSIRPVVLPGIVRTKIGKLLDTEAGFQIDVAGRAPFSQEVDRGGRTEHQYENPCKAIQTQNFELNQEYIRDKIEKFLSELDQFDSRKSGNFEGIESHLFY